jgi:predicted dehydrogenase
LKVNSSIGTQLQAAVIGLGVGERHIDGYEADPRCRVVALCDIDAKRLQEVSQRYPGRRLTLDPLEILTAPDIQVVSIASYDTAHRDQVLLALEQGKHVFVEKPLCLHANEFTDIDAALAARPELRLSSNLILRRSPRFIELKRRIAAGEFGRLYYLEGDYDYGRIEKILTGWRGQIPYYSVFHGGGIHLVDLLLWLSGGCVTEVFAYGNRLATQDTAFRYPDLIVALLKFEDGLIAKVSANFACMAPHHHKLSIYGTAATFTQNHGTAAYLYSRDPGAPAELVCDPYSGTSKGDMLTSFVRHILDGTPPDVKAREVLDAMAVSLAVEQSMRSGQPTRVRYAS